MQGQLETAPGGEPEHSLLRGEKMDKWEVCGLEVSARELVVAEGTKPVQRYVNTALGHDFGLPTQPAN